MDKLLRYKLKKLMEVVIQEAENNEDFSLKLAEVLNTNVLKNNSSSGKRGSNRRDPAVLDPIKLTEEGDITLRSQLEGLNEKQLKDIIADFKMDNSKLAMKWKDREKLIQLIMDVSSRRASKGDAFRT